MKKIIYFSFIFCLFIINSCDQFHDNIQPQDDLPIDAVYQSVNDLETALIGVYNTLQSGDLAGFNLIRFGDLLTCNGDFTLSGFPETFSIANHIMRSSNFRAELLWVTAYKAINEVNHILATIETLEDAELTDDVKNRITGEARFIRGVLYFELLRLFAPPYEENTKSVLGIPIMTESVSKQEDIQFPQQSTIEAVYQQAEDDISTAKTRLNGTNTYDKANRHAATAYLAKIAFQKREYALVATLCDELLLGGSFHLTETPQDVFDDNQPSSEIIWAIAYSSDDLNRPIIDWLHEFRARIFVHDDLKSAFENIIPPDQLLALEAEDLSVIDLRVDTTGFVGRLLISTDWKYINKYEDVASNSDDTPMARLSEFVLMRAEVHARAGKLEDGVDLLNQIRERSLRVLDIDGNEATDKRHLVLYKAADLTEAELIDAIILERRVELCFEGNYLQDMKRLKRDICGFAYNDCHLILPIPQREIDVNKNLVQGEGDCY